MCVVLHKRCERGAAAAVVDGSVASAQSLATKFAEISKKLSIVQDPAHIKPIASEGKLSLSDAQALVFQMCAVVQWKLHSCEVLLTKSASAAEQVTTRSPHDRFSRVSD